VDILSIEQLQFSYTDDTKIFNGLTLSFPDTTATAIIGQNGAGKTTLVKLMKGLLRQQSGRILYKGNDIATMSVAELARYIGLVFQNPDDQIFKHNVLEEVKFGPLNIGYLEEEAHAAALQALDKVGLMHLQDANPYDLNLSDRKMIAIASILAMNTPIVIFDEPTIAQDFIGKERIKKIIAQLKQAGKLVITIIHDMDFVAENFERTIILANGEKLVDADTKVAFQQTAILEKARLHVPHIMEVTKALGYSDTFLTVESFIQHYQKE